MLAKEQGRQIYAMVCLKVVITQLLVLTKISLYFSGSVPPPGMLQPSSQLANPLDAYPPQQPHTEYQPTLSQYPLPQLLHVGYQSILAPYSLPELSHCSHQPTFAQYVPPQRPHGRYQPIPAQYPLLQQPHGGYQQLVTQYPLPQQPYGTPSEFLQQGITQLNVLNIGSF